MKKTISEIKSIQIWLKTIRHCRRKDQCLADTTTETIQTEAFWAKKNGGKRNSFGDLSTISSEEYQKRERDRDRKQNIMKKIWRWYNGWKFSDFHENFKLVNPRSLTNTKRNKHPHKIPHTKTYYHPVTERSFFLSNQRKKEHYVESNKHENTTEDNGTMYVKY